MPDNPTFPTTSVTTEEAAGAVAATNYQAPPATPPQDETRMPADQAVDPEPQHIGPTPTKGEEPFGVEGEATIWAARYSMKNFIGRLTLGGILLVAWIALAVYTWMIEGAEYQYPILVTLLGIGLAIYWILLIGRILRAEFGRYYRLTNRRLFLSHGIFVRRRDQMELIQIDDVYTRQNFLQRLLSVGTVVVESKESNVPIMHLTGVDDPKEVMDLIWHYARAEREGKAVQVDAV